MNNMNTIKTILKALIWEIAMVPALIVAIAGAYKDAMWEIYDMTTYEGFGGSDLVCFFFNAWCDFFVRYIPLLAVLALIIAIIAVAVALHKGKEE